MDKLLLTPMECAEKLSLGRSRTYEMLASGELPSVRLGQRSIRIPVAALETWIATRFNNSGANPAEADTDGRSTF